VDAIDDVVVPRDTFEVGEQTDELHQYSNADGLSLSAH
jgi:hypothetical protein